MGDIEKLRVYASAFRDAFEEKREELAAASSAEKFKSFPKNCCGVASNLLAKFLSEKGFGKFMIVSGERAGNEVHHWLEQEDIIVDITADQFADCTERAIVTRDDLWHKTFGVDRQSHPADYVEYSSAVRVHDKMFQIIVDHLTGNRVHLE